jgi:hypothetical protein
MIAAEFESAGFSASNSRLMGLPQSAPPA